MGLPDLYPMDDAHLPTTHYVGGWSLMGLISGRSIYVYSGHLIESSRHRTGLLRVGEMEAWLDR